MVYDKDFLLKLDSYQHRVVYARITALTFQETPIEYIEGRVTQGSISVDGASAVRRTCSLTIAAPDFNYNDYYWGLNTKFKLEIGLENYVDTSYPDIIWFPQGVYLITTFNTTRNTKSFNISIQGKDKMCLLNGDIGGSLESSVDFGTIQEEDENGNWAIREIPIPDIIKNLVHTYAGEPYHNIIINDLETYGLELLEYRYDKDLFIYRLVGDNSYKNVTLDGTKSCTVHEVNSDGSYGEALSIIPLGGTEEQRTTEVTFETLPFDYLESLTDRLIVSNNGKYAIKHEGYYYQVAKITYGQTAGYRFTDLTYAGDLIANVGESLTSVLDKIKNMLVEFEYFYNLEGQFVFQKKKSLKEAIWQFNSDTKTQNPEYSYEFYGGNLITAFNNNPNLLNLRNDYSIWGEREGISGAMIPIHLRYAIDKKPLEYNSIIVGPEEVEAYNNKYGTVLQPQTNSVCYYKSDNYSISMHGEQINSIGCDWREIIYQMALDYYKYNFLDDFELRVAEVNPSFPSGRTGYEQYYIDLQGFWRELYNPEIENQVLEKENEVNSLQSFINALETDIENKSFTDLKAAYEDDLPLQDDNEDEASYRERLKSFLKDKQTEKSYLDEEFQELQETALDFYSGNEENTNLCYWNKLVYQQPDMLNFWFDFLDAEGELQQFSVKLIGNRPKAVNDKDVKSIYFRETPSIIYGAPNDQYSSEAGEGGYKYIQIGPAYDNMFSISSQGKGAKDKLDELIYQHGYCIESATITTIPIYHLEPNTRIYLYDDQVGLDGDYIVSKFTVPLTYNGTMQITATKAAENNLMYKGG